MSKTTNRLKSAGNGLLNTLVFVADLGPLTRMSAIEREIDVLQDEYAKLNETVESSRRRPTPYTK